MDQDNTKPGPEGMKGSWRDRLGINKDLPKIAEEFKEPSQKSEAAPAREPQERPSASPARAGAARPAPMAPRPNAAEFGERLRQQREAAERMAEQRVAEAKERAINEHRPQAPPQGPQQRTPSSTARPASQAPKPRFGFAEEELRGAPLEQPLRKEPSSRQWTGPQSASISRPVFTADRQGAAPDPRLRAPPPPRAPSAPQARNLPPAQGRMPPPGGTERQAPRPVRPAPPPPGMDRLRRTASADPARQFDEYAQDEPYPRAPRHAETARPRNDQRGAHSRELDYVDEEPDDLFEDDQTYAPQSRRRATAEDYGQAYREFDGPVQERERRRTGPFLLIGALVIVGIIAGGLVYFYHESLGERATSAENVPVVDEPSAPVKTEPESSATTEEQAPAAQEQSTAATSSEMQSPAAAQKKQIYDRILGETTLEEQEEVVPSEEQPVAPGGQTQGFDADPLPLPMPPSPGGGTDDQSGSLEPSGQSASVTSAKASSETNSEQASPTSATLATDPSEPAEESEAALAPPPAPSAPPAADAPDAPPPPEPAQASDDQPAPAPAQKAPTAEQKIASELAFAENPGSPPPQPASDGPIQIAQLPGFNASSEATTFAPSPQALPDETDGFSTTTQRRARPIGTRGTDKVVVTPNRNFNRSKQVQVAAIETDPVSTQSFTPVSPATQVATPPAQAAAPAPEAAPVGQQAALEPQAAQKPQISHGAGSGFTIQLASYKSEAEALAGYEQLRLQHGELLGSLSPNVQKAELGTSGTFYRLHLGSFSTKEAAKKACSSLLAAGERDCIVKSR
jgi:cell division protein FtsN/cytoskeletal protein RodZ